MRRGLPVLVWAVVWTLVVAGATLSVWSAISRAGAHVINRAAPALPGSTTLIPTSTPTPSDTPQTTARPTARATPRPTSRPTSHATTRPAPRPTRSDPTTDSPEPAAVQRSWTGQAGRVTATCRAKRIKLDAAVPADGFTVEIGSRGPETLEVEFHQTRGESESQVKGVCRAGSPSFAVEQK